MTAPMRPQVTPLPKQGPKVKAKKKARAPKAATLKNKATTLHSMVVRARAGYRCERCSRTDARMECAHIFSRRYTATRADETNAWCLCSGCHRYLTENPDEHVEFGKQTRGVEGYAQLKLKAYAGIGLTMKAEFWQGEVDRLNALLKEYTHVR